MFVFEKKTILKIKYDDLNIKFLFLLSLLSFTIGTIRRGNIIETLDKKIVFFVQRVIYRRFSSRSRVYGSLVIPK